jgi:hypothetical protein
MAYDGDASALAAEAIWRSSTRSASIFVVVIKELVARALTGTAWGLVGSRRQMTFPGPLSSGLMHAAAKWGWPPEQRIARVSAARERGASPRTDCLLHLFTSDGTARIPSMQYNGAGD